MERKFLYGASFFARIVFMRSMLTIFAAAIAAGASLADEVKIPRNESEDTGAIMSKKYWSDWNDEVQARIDRDIEANRKADAVLKIGGIAKGTKVKVAQISHDFIFGAHIFNFDQLGDKTLNAKYRSLYGTFFNSATVPFYWSKFEMQPDRPRFASEYWDSQEYWENSADPKNEMHWRRPPTDKIVDYLKENGVRVHGHALVWGSRAWAFPAWLFDKCLEGEEKEKFKSIIRSPMVDGIKAKNEIYNSKYAKMSPQELSEQFPKLAANLKREFADRIVRIAGYYGDKIESWDVLNESLADYALGDMNVGGKLMKSDRYKIMPADYTFDGFQAAQKAFPKNVKLNINDAPYRYIEHYKPQIQELVSRGCKIDIVGWQMHIFNPRTIGDVAAGVDGKDKLNMDKLKPSKIWKDYALVDCGIPIHMSEITITAPEDTERGRMVQAIITRNMYRIWFSLKSVMGVTWWNVVDDCGAKGEPSISGLFTRTMEPKPAFYALNQLLNSEWKTRLELVPDADGNIKFRGFRGKYRISWTDSDGNEKFMNYYLK